MKHDLNHIDSCPICNHDKSKKALSCRDETVSKDMFNIAECEACGFWYTNPIPSEITIGDYYKAEDYISHTSTNKGLFNKAYHTVRKRAISNKESLIKGLVDGRQLLDIGCGTGDFLAHCYKKGWGVTGLEPDDNARSLANEKEGVNARELKELFELKESSYDIITMWHVLEHVYHLRRDVTQFLKLLKPNGRLIVAVPNRLSHDALFYRENWAAYDLPRHLYHFREEDISNLFEGLGAKKIKTLPMKWDAYYVSMLSAGYKKSGKVSGVFRGWVSNMKASNNKYSSSVYIIQKK